MEYVVSADAGGTFLDLVIVDSSGRIGVGKALHTPEKPEVGILSAISVAANDLDTDAEDVLSNCKLVYNGTTVTTNAIIEGTGAITGLLCTKGFEDTVFIGRVRGRTAGLDEIELTRYTQMDRPTSIMPFTYIRGISERIDYSGNVLCPLNLNELKEKVEELLTQGVEAIAVCYLHSYINPAHEEMTKKFINEHYPHLHVMTSTEVAPVMGEYERMNTTIINAKLNPVLGRYLNNLESTLKTKGYNSETLVMQSIGGVSPSSQIRKQSISTLLSGPAGGIIGAQYLGEIMGEPNIITTDMGGTSFDVGVIVDGKPQYGSQMIMHRQIVLVPSVEIATIGAGGGSVAWLDSNLNIRVGPRSAGAYPGPACYGLGGLEPTVTDVDVVLGFIDPASLALGRSKVDFELAKEAIQRKISDPLGISPVEAADAVYQIVNNHMADLIRKATIEKGYDPREFVILAYGGNGPMHCTSYGSEVGAKKIVIPQYASVFSAYGIARADVKYSFAHSALLNFTQKQEDYTEKLEILNHQINLLIEKATEQVQSKGLTAKSNYVIECELDMRFKGQMTEVTVNVQEQIPLREQDLIEVLERFKAVYEMQYGTGASSSRSPIEIVNARVNVVVPLPYKYNVAPQPADGKSSEQAIKGTRTVYWGNEIKWRKTDVYDVSKLHPGNEITGPALVDLFKSTIPVYEGQRLYMDSWRNLIVEIS